MQRLARGAPRTGARPAAHHRCFAPRPQRVPLPFLGVSSYSAQRGVAALAGQAVRPCAPRAESATVGRMPAGRDSEPVFFAPFVSSVLRVEPGWIDYNGHLNMAYYNVLFDRAVDEVYELLGCGLAYVQQTRH